MAFIYGNVSKCQTADGVTRNEYECRLGYQVNSQSIATNKSNITLRLEVRSISSSYRTYGYNQTSTIDGTTLSAQTFDMRDTNVWQLFGERTFDIKHNADGTYSSEKWGSFETTASSTYSLKRGSASVTVAPPTIPRYATVNQSLNSKTETSITMNWSSDSTIDYVWYSKDNGTNWTAVGSVNATSGSYTISNLTANTSYNIKTRVRRKDSQLTTDSSTSQQTTYDYPKVSNVGTSALIIGNNQTLTLYNPLGRSVTVKMYQNNTSGTQLYSGTTSGTSITFKPTASTLYASIPSSQSGNCVYSVIYSNVSTKTTSTYTYKIRGDELPTFSDSNWSYTANLTSLTNDNQVVINNQSNVTFSVDTAATSNYSATITKYVYVWGNKSVNSTSSDTISKGNGNVLTVIAVDSRNLQKSTSKTLVEGTNYVSYTNPIVNEIGTQRENGIGAATVLNLSGTFFNAKFGNDGVQNALYSAKYYTSTNGTTWSSAYPSGDEMLNAITVNNNNFTLSNFNIHANGSSGGFTVGTRYYVKVEISDGQGLLYTVVADTTITDGKIARDVFQDTNGDYHEGINGLASEKFIQDVHGNVRNDSVTTGDIICKNLFNIYDYKIVEGCVGFNISELEIGKKYTFSSNLPLTVLKISNYPSGYNSVIKSDNNGFTKHTFTMARNSNIPSTATQYMFFKVNDSWVTSMSMLSEYKIQIENGEESSNIGTYKKYGYNPFISMGNLTIDNIKIVEDITSKNIFNINGNVNIRGNNGSQVSKNTVSGDTLTANSNTVNEHSVGQKFTSLNGKTITFSATVVSVGTGRKAEIQFYDNGTGKTATNGVVGERISATYTCTSDNLICTFATNGGTGAQFTDIQVEIDDGMTSFTPFHIFNSDYEKITNSDGTALKFSNGIMVCYKLADIPANSTQIEKNLPAAYINSDYWSFIENAYGNHLNVFFGIGAKNASTVNIYVRTVSNGAIDTSETFKYITIGRWK